MWIKAGTGILVWLALAAPGHAELIDCDGVSPIMTAHNVRYNLSHNIISPVVDITNNSITKVVFSFVSTHGARVNQEIPPQSTVFIGLETADTIRGTATCVSAPDFGGVTVDVAPQGTTQNLDATTNSVLQLVVR